MRIALASVLLITACGGAEVPSSSGAAVSPPLSPGAPGSVPAPTPTSMSPVAGMTPSSAPCPVALDRPLDCGPYAAACAGARPVAIGTFSRIGHLAVESSYLYWSTEATDLATCGGTIYATTTGGGDSDTTSRAVTSGASVAALRAAPGGSPLFWAEPSGGYAIHRVEGSADSILTTIADTGLSLVASSAGVLAVTDHGIGLLTADQVAPLHGPAPGALGSLPAYDGSSLVASQTDGTLVRWDTATGGAATLATDATARNGQTVIIDGGDVFYVSGDPEIDAGGLQPHPMGIYRVPLIGGEPVALVTPSAQDIDAMAIDATRVYFVVGNDIRAVARSGGVVVPVATLGAPPRDLQVSGGIYFILDVHPQYGELTGPGGVIAWVPVPR